MLMIGLCACKFYLKARRTCTMLLLQIEARTGKDIELKQHQLRQLVGNSYR